MKQVTIESLKKGELFWRKPEAKSPYVFDGYCRYDRTYEGTYWEDISKGISLPKGKMVWTGITF